MTFLYQFIEHIGSYVIKLHYFLYTSRGTIKAGGFLTAHRVSYHLGKKIHLLTACLYPNSSLSQPAITQHCTGENVSTALSLMLSQQSCWSPCLHPVQNMRLLSPSQGRCTPKHLCSFAFSLSCTTHNYRDTIHLDHNCLLDLKNIWSLPSMESIMVSMGLL